jgi:hypothetical protein
MINIKENYNLLNHNTFGVDVKCSWFFEYSSGEQIKKFLEDKEFKKKNFYILGRGVIFCF